jgi:hypothetical protein
MLDEAPLAPFGGVGAVLIGDVETGSLDDYANLDHETESTEDNKDDDDDDDDSEENHGS